MKIGPVDDLDLFCITHVGGFRCLLQGFLASLLASFRSSARSGRGRKSGTAAELPPQTSPPAYRARMGVNHKLRRAQRRGVTRTKRGGLYIREIRRA